MKKILFTSLFLAALLERTVFDLGPNIELVTTAMLLASAYLGRRWSLGLVLLVMAISDIILGNSQIYIFTWTGFVLPALLAAKGFEKFKSNRAFLATGMGLGANLFFYFWTNLGVWWLDAWGMYANSFGGLVMSYINGLPFLKFQVASTLAFVPITFLVAHLATKIHQNLTKTIFFRKNLLSLSR